MTKLMVDPTLERKLTASAELTNAGGRTLGFFLMPEEHARLRKLDDEHRALYSRANALFTDAELDAFDGEGGEYTYDDVKRELATP